MPLCVKCNRVVCFPCIQANSNSEARRRVYVASDDELSSKSYFQRLAIATAARMNELDSREAFPDWMANVIYFYEGEILWCHGGCFILLDNAIDDAFGNDDSFRWLSHFARFAYTPPAYRPHRQLMGRLRLIDLTFRIDRPDVARHFAD